MMITGTIVRKREEGGYGFIKQDEEGAKDVFFHARTSMAEGVTFDDLHEGDKVTFEVKESEKGLQAVNVQPA